MAKGQSGQRGSEQLTAVSKLRRGRPANLTNAEKQYIFSPTFAKIDETRHVSEASRRSVERVKFWKGKSLEFILHSDIKYDAPKGLTYKAADFHYDRKYGYLKDVPNADDKTIENAEPRSKLRSKITKKKTTPTPTRSSSSGMSAAFDLKARARMFASSRLERATQHTACKVSKAAKSSVAKTSLLDEQNDSISEDLKKKDLKIETLRNNLAILIERDEKARAAAETKISALEQKIKFYKVSMHMCNTNIH